MSISYYNKHAQEFFNATAHADMSALHARFLHHLLPGARILDAGCGSGRDALAFTQAGFQVTAFDASAEMVRLATANTGLPVIQMAFNEIAWENTFHGIWACASLLHVPRADLAPVSARLVRALVPGAIIFMSFKLGESEREKDGRCFTDMTELLLAKLLDEIGSERLELWQSEDARPGRESEKWVSTIVRRQAFS
jgi:2-polyprenyl-3-methyl-5-hydroxy-6-metoxy-1,4-benzoquinol methylase